jgi:hypothetical protein
MKRTLLLMLLVGCGARPALEERYLWITADFLAARDAGVSFGGWRTDALISASGELAALPAFSAGRPAAYAVTEIWYATPNPWVQPTYMNPGNPDALAVFPVGSRGSFYSPFWRATLYARPGAPLRSAKEVLDSGGPLTPGAIVVCPIVPEGTTVADTHPLTGAALRRVALNQAFVDGAKVPYLALGFDRVQARGALLDEARLFAWVAADGAALDLPVVLEDDATERSFARRFEVTLPASARAFWPASRPPPPGLSGVVGEADPSLDGAAVAPWLLRVALDGACFKAAAGFPGSCTWLDSPAAIEAALTASKVRRTDVTLTATVIPEVP